MAREEQGHTCPHIPYSVYADGGRGARIAPVARRRNKLSLPSV